MGDNSSDAYVFFELVYGPIQQAVDVITSCLEYNSVPFFRWSVALNYSLLLSENLIEFQNLKDITFKACVASFTYRICEKEKLGQRGFTEFAEIVQSSQFSNNLYNCLADANIRTAPFECNVGIPIIETELKKLYSKLAAE